MKFILFCIGLLCSLASLSKEHESLIQQHRWSAGGSTSLSLSIDRRMRTSLDLEWKPQISYFVLNGLEIAFNNQIVGTIATSDTEGLKHMPITWGLGTDIRYYFSLKHHLYPYMGAFADFSLINAWRSSFIYNFGVEGGLLIGITERLAIDITMPVKIKMAASYFQHVALSATCLGLRYFF